MSRALPAVCLLLLGGLAAGCPAPQVLVANPAGGSPSPAATSSSSPNAMPTIGTTPAPGQYTPAGVTHDVTKDAPPFLLPEDTLQRVHDGGLSELSAEAFNYHVHSHLDVFVDGKPVSVPGLIGIARTSPFFISPIHTHSDDGIIHIEAPEKKDFQLKQFLAEWGVSSNGFKGYVNGNPYSGDVGNILLVDHTEIMLTYGTAPASVPATYPPTGP